MAFGNRVSEQVNPIQEYIKFNAETGKIKVKDQESGEETFLDELNCIILESNACRYSGYNAADPASSYNSNYHYTGRLGRNAHVAIREGSTVVLEGSVRDSAFKEELAKLKKGSLRYNGIMFVNHNGKLATVEFKGISLNTLINEKKKYSSLDDVPMMVMTCGDDFKASTGKTYKRPSLKFFEFAGDEALEAECLEMVARVNDFMEDQNKGGANAPAEVDTPTKGKAQVDPEFTEDDEPEDGPENMFDE